MMLPAVFDAYAAVWVVDYEFTPREGELPQPICVVAHEVRSGRHIEVWEDELGQLASPPYPVGRSSLFVAYVSQAEMSCHLAMRWPLPVAILDLYVEFRNATNGLDLDHGRSLLGALAYYGLEAMGAGEKHAWQALAQRGGPWTREEREGLLAYCATDVLAEVRLLTHLAPRLNLSQARFRGHYIRAVAQIEAHGIPVDHSLYNALLEQWNPLKYALVERINPRFGFPYHKGDHFRHAPLLAWAATQGIEWPLTPTGRAVLEMDALKDLVLLYPQIEPFRQLRKTLNQMRTTGFPIGRDHRNRFLLWPYGTKTGRNAPGTSVNLMGAASWLRSLIQAPSGYGLAYIDWAQQEYGIAAAFSHDRGMQLGYLSGDPYLALARMAKAVPSWATKTSHAAIREQYKTVSLGVLYGMRGPSLARRLGLSESAGEQLLADHQQAFPTFWAWSQRIVQQALFIHHIQTVYGWRLHCGPSAETNVRSIANFPMQANGSEMMKVACCLVLEAGVAICAVVHDALLIMAPLPDLSDAIQTTQRCMAQASRTILRDFALTSDVQIFPHPQHYVDARGLPMWALIQEFLGRDILAANATD
jgi:hypothetical protein